MSKPDAMPEVAVRLFRLRTGSDPATWSEADSPVSTRWIAMPRAEFGALAAKAARAEALATALGEARGSVAKILAYAIESAAVCREAEEERRSDLSKRENGTIADMLREQVFAWGEKAKSYDALVVFIDALLDAAGGMGGG